MLDVCRVKQPQPVAEDAGPLAQMLTLPAPRRAPAPLPLRPAHRAHARAGDRRRQQRVPVDQPGPRRAPRALRVQHAHLAGEDAAVRRPDEVRRRAPAPPTRTGSATGAGAARRRSRRGPARAAEDDGYLVSYVHDERDGSLRGARARRARHVARSPSAGCGCPCACRSASTPPGSRASRCPAARPERVRPRLGVSLGLWQDRDPLEALETARIADELGYPELWIGEMATWDAFALAAAIARETRVGRAVRRPARDRGARPDGDGDGRRERRGALRAARRTSRSAARARWSSSAGTGAAANEPRGTSARRPRRCARCSPARRRASRESSCAPTATGCASRRRATSLTVAAFGDGDRPRRGARWRTGWC